MSLPSLLTALGVGDGADRGGEEICYPCPFHEQRTGEADEHPSFWINRNSGLNHCWSCEYQNNLVGLVMDLTGLGLWDARKHIRDHDVDTDVASGVVDFAKLPSLKVIKTLEPDYDSFINPPERALKRRGIDPDTARTFGVCWRPDRPLGAWILPIRSPKGTLWGWQVKKGQRVENHPPGIRKALTLFGLDQFRDGSLAVLVESPLDVLVLHQHGYHALASFGAEVSQEQQRLIRERTDRLLLAFDNDTPGRQGTERLLFDRRVAFIDLSVINYRHSPDAKDPGEMSGDEIELALAMAVPATKWLIEGGA
jgi:hypothetical protein